MAKAKKKSYMGDLFLPLKRFFKRIGQTFKDDYRHYICSGITLASIVFIALYFEYMPLRIFEGLRDVGNSLVFYFNELFDLDLRGTITVNQASKAPFVMPFGFPPTWEEFKVAWARYWELWASKENFNAYILVLADVLFYVSKILCIALPIVSALVTIFALKKSVTNNDHNYDSKALKKWKRFEKTV